uniref:Uncharacterized protein n=1 Tax=Marseillevirus LCMAC102 TaxID=2506603 RepID=A0A481YSN0_9VIRU|nr:MAG: hypothetical protein LCMAC102_00220 [Marseillevirus LCMAC102]
MIIKTYKSCYNLRVNTKILDEFLIVFLIQNGDTKIQVIVKAVNDLVPCPNFYVEEIEDLVWDRLQALDQDNLVGKYFRGERADMWWYYSDAELSGEEIKFRNRIIIGRIKHMFTLEKK